MNQITTTSTNKKSPLRGTGFKLLFVVYLVLGVLSIYQLLNLFGLQHYLGEVIQKETDIITAQTEFAELSKSVSFDQIDPALESQLSDFIKWDTTTNKTPFKRHYPNINASQAHLEKVLFIFFNKNTKSNREIITRQGFYAFGNYFLAVHQLQSEINKEIRFTQKLSGILFVCIWMISLSILFWYLIKKQLPQTKKISFLNAANEQLQKELNQSQNQFSELTKKHQELQVDWLKTVNSIQKFQNNETNLMNKIKRLELQHAQVYNEIGLELNDLLKPILEQKNILENQLDLAENTNWRIWNGGIKNLTKQVNFYSNHHPNSRIKKNKSSISLSQLLAEITLSLGEGGQPISYAISIPNFDGNRRLLKNLLMQFIAFFQVEGSSEKIEIKASNKLNFCLISMANYDLDVLKAVNSFQGNNAQNVRLRTLLNELETQGGKLVFETETTLVSAHIYWPI